MRRLTDLVQMRVALVFLWFGLLVTWWSSEPVISNDTGGYAAASSLSDIPWLGASQRAWPTMLVYLMTDSPRWLTLTQTVLYACAWSFAIWVFFRRSSGVIGAVGIFSTVILALTPAMMQWNMALLSESVTISFLVAGVAAGLRAIDVQTDAKSLDRRTILWTFLSILMLGLSTLNRPTYLFALLAVGGLIALALWRRNSSLVSSALVISLTVLVSLYALFVNANIDQYWGVSRSTTHYLYLTSVGGTNKDELTDPLFVYVSQRGPACLTSFRASSVDPETDPWQMRRILNEGCPDGVAWLNANFIKVYAQFMISHPQYVHWYVRSYGPSIMGPDNYAGVVTVIPFSLANLFQTSSVGDQKFVPFIAWLGILLCCVGFVALRFRRLTDKWGLVYLSLSGSAVLVSALATLLTQSWQVMRIAVPSSGALILICLALGAKLLRQVTHEGRAT